MEMSSKTSGYTVIEEYTGVNRECKQSSYVNVNTPDVTRVEPTITKNDLLDNPVLFEPMYDLYGDSLTAPTTFNNDKMVTESTTTLALPAPVDSVSNTITCSTPTTSATTAVSKAALPEFSQEYKESLQANAADTADTKLDNMELPDEDTPELKEFLAKLEASKTVTTSTSTYSNYGYGGSNYYSGSSYYGNSYSNYSNNYSSSYNRYGSNNYDYYNSKRGSNWYSKYYDDDDYEYPSNKRGKVETTESKVTFSDEAEAAKESTKDVSKEAESAGSDINVKDLNELKDLMLTKFSTMVKLFTRTLQMVSEVKKTQTEIKNSQAQLTKEIRIMSQQMDYMSRNINYIKNSFADGSDDGREAHYGFDSDDDYTSSDDITKKGKFDNRVPKINDIVNL
jgi:hypothetical protein